MSLPDMKPKRTILCVDDHEQSLSIRKVLLETRGYRVIACSSGEEALELFRKGGIDLVLTDLIMPGLDGTKLVEQIKAISPQTPAILLSGYIAGGKMHKPGMVGAANEFKNFDGRVGIRGKSIAKIGIEIGEPRAIDDQV